jgi:hypothetical protein
MMKQKEPKTHVVVLAKGNDRMLIGDDKGRAMTEPRARRLAARYMTSTFRLDAAYAVDASAFPPAQITALSIENCPLTARKGNRQ